MNRRAQTDFLIPDSGFLVGMGTVIAISGNSFLYNYSTTMDEADKLALESDWRIIGQDIREGIQRFAGEMSADEDPECNA